MCRLMIVLSKAEKRNPSRCRPVTTEPESMAHGPCIIRGHSVAGLGDRARRHSIFFFRPEIRLDNAVISSVRLSSLTVRSVRLESQGFEGGIFCQVLIWYRLPSLELRKTSRRVATMVFDKVFERFVTACPACVMFRALMEHIFAPAKLDALFHQAAKKQYARELLFSTLVELVSQIVTRASKSVHAAYKNARDEIPVSLHLYDKLSHVEPGTSRALVQYVAGEVSGLIDGCGGRCQHLLKGYRVRILDGNHLGKTQHRLGVLRGTAAGDLPGQCLRPAGSGTDGDR